MPNVEADVQKNNPKLDIPATLDALTAAQAQVETRQIYNATVEYPKS